MATTDSRNKMMILKMKRNRKMKMKTSMSCTINTYRINTHNNRCLNSIRHSNMPRSQMGRKKKMRTKMMI